MLLPCFFQGNRIKIELSSFSITDHQPRLDAHFPEGLHNGSGFRTDGVADSQKGGQTSVHGHMDHRGPVVLHPLPLTIRKKRKRKQEQK